MTLWSGHDLRSEVRAVEFPSQVTFPAAIPDGAPTPPPKTTRSKTWLVLADTLAMAAALAIGIALLGRVGPDAGLDFTLDRYLSMSGLSLPVWPILFARHRLYNARFLSRRIEEYRRIVSAVGGGVLALMVVGYAAEIYVSRRWLAMVFFLGVALVGLEREFARRMFKTLRRRGRLLRSVVIVGTNTEARELALMLGTDRTLGYRVVAFVDDDPSAPEEVLGIPLLGTTSSTAAVARVTGAVGVIIAATAVDLASSNRLIRELTDEGVHVELSSTLRDIAAHRLTVRPLGRFPVVYIEPVRRNGWRSIAKRTFDVVLATVSLVAALPVLALAAMAIKLDSRGPVFFSQERIGRRGEGFRVLKLRTMVRDAEQLQGEVLHLNEANGPLFKIRDDPRTTRVGRFLRKTSVDELPQLWNVLHGEMSLVGPRPALPSEVPEWGAELRNRLRVKPGITGMWQVNGRSSASFEDYERLDLYYVDNWSLVADLSILLKTIPAVLFGRGAC